MKPTTSICPDCKTIVPARDERCPACGRRLPMQKQDCPACRASIPARAEKCPECGRMLRIKSAPQNRTPLILAAVFVALLAIGLAGSYFGVSGPLNPGDHAVCHHDAWLAVDDAAFDELVDAERAASPELLARLVVQGRIFREAAGTDLLVIRAAMGGRFVRVGPSGANPGAEGWIQREELTPKADH